MVIIKIHLETLMKKKLIMMKLNSMKRVSYQTGVKDTPFSVLVKKKLEKRN